MGIVTCNNCGKALFSTTETNSVRIGIEVQNNGYIYKNACLFSREYSNLYFCDHYCTKAFYKAHIPSNPEATEALNKFRENIPQYAKECSLGLAKLVEIINRRKNGNTDKTARV
jgi:hypothetical protein